MCGLNKNKLFILKLFRNQERFFTFAFLIVCILMWNATSNFYSSLNYISETRFHCSKRDICLKLFHTIFCIFFNEKVENMFFFASKTLWRCTFVVNKSMILISTKLCPVINKTFYFNIIYENKEILLLIFFKSMDKTFQ